MLDRFVFPAWTKPERLKSGIFGASLIAAVEISFGNNKLRESSISDK